MYKVNIYKNARIAFGVMVVGLWVTYIGGWAYDLFSSGVLQSLGTMKYFVYMLARDGHWDILGLITLNNLWEVLTVAYGLTLLFVKKGEPNRWLALASIVTLGVVFFGYWQLGNLETQFESAWTDRYLVIVLVTVITQLLDILWPASPHSAPQSQLAG